ASHVAAVEDVHPDLILNIDHLRSEQGDAFPKNVPFVSWLQDLLPNLTCEEAGRSIGPTDFYIAAGITELVRRYRYPASQGLAWTMATNEAVYCSELVPEEGLTAHRCDFSYVSNQTEPPHRFHERWLETVRDLRGGARLIEYVYAALCESWEHDPRNACSRPAMALLAEATRATGIPATTPDNEDQIARRYIHGLTELLFRQRTLEWVADYCDRTGRTLKLYGRGWESHPRFARYACGVAANGDELRAIYQASRINLQITSYGAMHQRLLDGLASGGFFLLRFCRHDVIDKPARRLLAAVERDGLEPDTPYRTDAMPHVVDALEQLPEMFARERRPGCLVLPRAELDRYREHAATGFRRVAAAVFDCYRDIAFGTAEEFERLADRYLAGAEDRGCLAASMREVVLQKYTYGALVDALLAFVTERLTAQGV
ncbi:MAG: hypothetical protein ACE5FI_15630, partial [Anaerolineales bacterium]